MLPKLPPMTSKTRGKSLSREQNEHLRAVVRELIDKDFGGVVTRAAVALGVTQPTLTNFLNNALGAGPKLIQGIADYTGRSIDSLYGRPQLSLPSGGYQLLAQHPQWKAALAEAIGRKSRLVRAAQLEAIGAVALSKPPEHLTADFIIGMAEAFAKAEPFDDPET